MADGPPANDCCSVCHGRFNVPCQANCSHWFCGDCIMLVWHHGSALQPCKCPLCRRQITLLVPGEASLSERHNPQVSETLGKLETYNRLFGGRSTGLIQRTQDLPFLLRRLLREIVDPQRTLPLVIRARVYIGVFPAAYDHTFDYMFISYVLWRPSGDVFACAFILLQMVLSAVYILSPVDIIPEAILGVVGLLDDLFIVLIFLLHIAAMYRSVLYYRHGGS